MQEPGILTIIKKRFNTMEIQKIGGKIIIGPIVDANPVQRTIAACERALKNPVQEPRVQFIPVPFACVSIIRRLAAVQGELRRIYQNLDNCMLKDVEIQTPEVCFNAVSKNAYDLLYIKEQTSELCLAAVRQNPRIIKYIDPKYQTAEIALAVVKKEGWLLEYIDPQVQTDEVCLTAIHSSRSAIRDVANQKPEYCMEALKAGARLGDIKTQFRTQEIVNYAIQKEPSDISYINNPSEELQLEAVRQDGTVIQFIHAPISPAVLLAAVEQNADAFKHIKPKYYTPEICLAAVKGNGFFLHKIANQTPELCKAAVAQDPKWERFVKNKSMLGSDD
jgi:hypothetical protein